MHIGIYSITNAANGKAYYGKSVNMPRRWREHLNRLRRGVHPNQHLQNAFIKYGEENFEFSVVEYCPEAELATREAVWLTKQPGGYNIRIEVGNGYRHAIETRQKIAVAATGRRLSADTRAKISRVHAGKCVSSITRKKIATARQGKRHTTKTCAKIAAARVGKGIAHTEDARHRISIALKKYWQNKKEETCSALSRG